jgi:putative peptidoglycan lipid II flippase
VSESGSSGLLGSSAVMAAGTVVSRLSGFVRSALLVAALGNGLRADVFNVANTIPNMLYILLAGGIFNAVLVPQLVRAKKSDPDEGAAYTDRVITLAAMFLALVSVFLVLIAPLLLRLYLAHGYYEPDHAAQLESVIDFTRLCLPQVFFYGMFVLLGQVLNARGRFGPMMWAPIANNLIATVVLATYLLTYGPASPLELHGGYVAGQEWLLGLGSTLGIAVQLVVLLPYLRSAGVHYRPRFDFRNSGLSHTLRLGLWTVLFVVVNQLTYLVVVNRASGGPTSGGGADATGYTVYAWTFLIVMVPHSVITVSLATAVLPRLSTYAAVGDQAGLASSLGLALRSALVVIVPFALLLPFLSRDLAHIIWGFGAGSTTYDNFAPSLALFGIGLVFFTVHYLTLRGFYALERTRTIFWVQCVIGAVNATLAVVLVAHSSPAHTVPALVIAYAIAYAVGAAVSWTLLHRLIGQPAGGELVRFLVRLLLASLVSAGLAALAWWGLSRLGRDPTYVVALVRAAAITAVAVGGFVLMARALRLREVTDVLALITRRLPARSRP